MRTAYPLPGTVHLSTKARRDEYRHINGVDSGAYRMQVHVS